jgi:N-acyl-L-homoserine lactone synthetase
VFRYRIAEAGTDDLENWHRLRTQLYLEAGLVTAADLDSSGMYRDQYSEHSIHILAATDDGVDIGCWRMIEPAEGRTLQVTDLFGIDVLAKAYESSGAAIVPKYRRSIAALGFYRASYELAEEGGYEYTYGIVEEPVPESVRRFGFPIEVISEPRNVFGAPNVVVLTRRGEIVESIRAADATRPGSALAHLWERPFTWTLAESDLNPSDETIDTP